MRIVGVLRPVLYIAGLLLLGLAAFMLIPALLNFIISHDEWLAFIQSSAASTAIGFALIRFFRPTKISLDSRQMFLLTSLVWLAVSLFAALPMLLLQHISYTDAFFETMSGITTTGSTIFSHLESLSPGLLLWRSLLQWIGGIGFIGMAVAILPFLRVGGMRLFQTESSDWSAKAVSRTTALAKLILVIYLGLTVLCVVSYYLAGMNGFDAVNHALTTVSTGGYSTYDDSMAHFKEPLIHWLAIVFMISGSLPFTLYVRSINGNWQSLFQDRQVRGFLIFLALTSLVLGSWLALQRHIPFTEALRLAAFNITSIVTTTGYALTDYTLWGSFAVTLFFYLTFVGGCSGSTAGGLKIFRFQVALIILQNHMRQLLYPNAVITQRYNGQTITDDIIRSVLGVSFFFTITIGVMALGLSLLGLDFVSSLSGAATAVTNVGPGLGDIIGPAGNFSSLPDMAKWLLSMGMLMGRLEVITVLMLFAPFFWQE